MILTPSRSPAGSISNLLPNQVDPGGRSQPHLSAALFKGRCVSMLTDHVDRTPTPESRSRVDPENWGLPHSDRKSGAPAPARETMEGAPAPTQTAYHRPQVIQHALLGAVGAVGCSSLIGSVSGNLPVGLQIAGLGCLVTGAASLATGMARQFQPDPQDHDPCVQPIAQAMCGVLEVGVGVLGLGGGGVIPAYPALAVGGSLAFTGAIGCIANLGRRSEPPARAGS